MLLRINDLVKELDTVKNRELSHLAEISRLKSAENILVERDRNIDTLETIINDLKRENIELNQQKLDHQNENKVLMSQIDDIDMNNSSAINVFEQN